MANVLVQESSLQAIANAIRQKNGSQDTYTPAQMGPAIAAISGGAEALEPHYFDLDTGYVYTDCWRIGGDTVNYSDVYQVEADKTYLLTLGSVVGSRFRAVFTTQDTSAASSNVTGTTLVYQSNPAAYAAVVFKAADDGYVTVTKDNAGTADLKTYLFCIEDLTASAQ